MPTVQRHEQLEGWIYSAARKFLFRKRPGIHVSDLSTPRKKYWAEVLPRPPSNAEIGYFLAGRAHEEAIARATELGAYRKSRGEWEGIGYEMDMLVVAEDGQEIPTEVKTNRRPRLVEAQDVLEVFDLAITQLGSYCAAKNLHIGYLVQFYLKVFDENETAPSQPKIETFQVNWSDAELDSIRDWMRLRRDLILESLAKNDHTILPECPSWMCARLTIVYSDPYCPSCGKVYKVGEEREDGTKSGVKKKCDDCMDGRKKVDLIRPSEEKFSPSCRWIVECRPSSFAKYLDKEPKTQDNGTRQEGPP